MQLAGDGFNVHQPIHQQNDLNVTEQNERSRESTEQWREFHYDGMHPPYEYNRHSVWGSERRRDAVSWQDANL